MRYLMLAVMALWMTQVWTTRAVADGLRGAPPGAFDYYVMALSWSPTWCALDGTARGADQCAPDADFGWILHGLWPNYEDSYPEYCPTTATNPRRSDSAAMADIMGSGGLAFYQWKKHGRCTGLDGRDYYALSRQAFGTVTRPAVFRKLDREILVPAKLVEEAFLQDNPDLGPDMVTVTCEDGRIDEVRICLTRDLEPRNCAPDTRDDCRATRALFAPIP